MWSPSSASAPLWCRSAFWSRARCWRRGASIRGDCRDGSPRGTRRRDALHRDRVRLPARDPGRARPRAVRRPAGPDGEGANAAPAVARTRRATRAGGRGRGTGDDARAQAKDARVVCGGPCERAPAARATEDTGATDVVAVGADTGRCSVVSREGERMSTGRELAVIEPATGELVHEYVAPQPMTFAEVVDRLATDEALEQQQKLMTAYDRACRALISENDIQREGRR